MTYDCMLRICFKTFGALCIQMKDRILKILVSYEWAYFLCPYLVCMKMETFWPIWFCQKILIQCKKICVLQFPCKELFVKCWSKWHLHYVLFIKDVSFSSCQTDLGGYCLLNVCGPVNKTCSSFGFVHAGESITKIKILYPMSKNIFWTPNYSYMI